MLGAYRKGEANDPDVWAASIVAILATYPEDIVWRVTDPRTGLAGKSQFMPSAYDVRTACEALMKAMAPPKPIRCLPPDVPAFDRAASLERIKARNPELFADRERSATFSESTPDYSGKPIFIDPRLMQTTHMKGREE